MIPLPGWLFEKRVLAHLVGGGLAVAIGTAFGLVPALRWLGIAGWPVIVQDLTVTVLGIALVCGPVVAVLGLAALAHQRSTAD